MSKIHLNIPISLETLADEISRLDYDQILNLIKLIDLAVADTVFTDMLNSINKKEQKYKDYGDGQAPGNSYQW